MTLVDTSAWIEHLRGTGSPLHHTVRDLIASDTVLYTTDTVLMDVLAGGSDEQHARKLRRLLLSTCQMCPTELEDFESAAMLLRRCRRGGETVRALADCLIAAVAIRSGLQVLSADRDFDALARHSDLRLHPVG